MPRPKFKQRCVMCKDNMVIMYSQRQFPICVDCEMEQINKPIKNAKMKKMFDIPEEYYRENKFLRSIKNSYIRFENLSEKQVDAFKKTVKEIKEGPKEEKKQEE